MSVAGGLRSRSSDPVVAPAPGAAPSRRPVVAAVVLTLVALAPALAAVVVRAGSDYVPVQDLAIIDLRVRDVWSSHVPLVGPYSKGWSHPGPLLFWLLAIPSGLFGQAAWATPVGGALLQAGAIAGSARLAWRKGGLALLLVALAVLGLSYSATGGWMVMDAWNPNIAPPFFVLFVMAVWAMADGARWAAPVATGVGTFLVQTHIGYLPLVGAAGAVAVVLVIGAARRDGRSLRPWLGAVWWSVGVGVLLWLPAVVEQRVSSPGNVTRMVRYFRGGGGDTAGVGRALELLAAEFRPPLPWLGGGERSQPLTSAAELASVAWLAIPVLLLVGGLVAARRSGSRSARNLVVLVGATSLAAVVAIQSSPSTLEPYLFRWRVPLAVLVVAAAGLAVAEWLGLRRSPWARRGAAVALLAAIVLPSADLTRSVLDAPEHLSGYEVAVADAADQIDARGAATEPVLVRFEGSNAGGMWGGLIDELDRRGAPVRVDPQLDYQYGEQRTATRGEVAAVWYAVDDSYLMSLLADLPDAEVVALVTPLSAREEADLSEAQQRLAVALRRAGEGDRVGHLDTELVGFALGDVPGVDQRDLATVARLNQVVHRRGGCRCGVVAFPPDSPSLARVRELHPD